MRSLTSLVFVGAVLLASPTMAATAFLTAKDVDAALILPPPPERDSPREAAEIAEIEALVAARTPAQTEEAARDAKDETGAWFASVLGPSFDFAKLPATARLLADIGETEEDVAKGAKAVFHRDRPWIVIPNLATCTPHKDGPAPTSYPSGHSTRGFAMAITLARLMPDKAPAILGRAELYAERRMLCGAHFRSDIVAGEALGTLIAERLRVNASFVAEYDAAAAELAAAHLR